MLAKADRGLNIACADGRRLALIVRRGPKGEAFYRMANRPCVVDRSLKGLPGLDTIGEVKTNKPEAFVVYCRVSSREQARSGLGLEAQRAACEASVASVGGRIVGVFSEQQSGHDDDRPELGAALRLAVRHRATLIVSRLDRLSRRVATIANMIASAQRLRVADCPDASVLELHLRAIVAEEERTSAGERMRAALARAKARGTKLGSARPGAWRGKEHLRRAGAALGSARAAEAARKARQPLLEQAGPVVEQLAGSSLRAIGAALEAAGVVTARGCSAWPPATVRRLLDALAEPKA